jgi:hypothetical protein
MSQLGSMSLVGPARRRLKPWRVALLSGLALSLGLAAGIHAATTWTVCASGCKYMSIKAAIAAPTTLDGDTLAIGAGTYTEPGITVNKSLTLRGEAAPTTIVQAAITPQMATDRVFTIPSGVTVTLQALTIRYGQTAASSNSPSRKGGGLFNAGTLTLTHSTVHNNTAVSYLPQTLSLGGGVANEGVLTVSHSTIRDNSAGVGGGFCSEGPLTVTHSTISGNSASYGGGLSNNDSPLTVTHSTISGNSAYEGGGLNSYGGRVILTHSTISGNSASYGGGLSKYLGPLTLTSSIVARNWDGGDCDPYLFFTSHGYNLDSDGSCELTAATDRPGVDPLLGLLQDNGGPTLTHALLPGSPAIDAIPWGTNGCGTTEYSDQRWQARPQPAGGACDIGAYEVAVAGQSLEAWVAGLTPQSVTCQNLTTGQEVTLGHPASPWACEAAGIAVTAGDQVRLRVQGPVKTGATDVGGAVTGLVPTGGGCTNRTTGQAVKFETLFQGQRGATAASCVAAGLVIHAGDAVQMQVQGVAE